MEITLVYPHQLFAKHPAIAIGRSVWLIEDPLLFGNDAHWPAAMHQQKLMLHRASMKAYAAELEGKGHHVQYIEAFDKLELPAKTKTIHLADPADDVLMRRVRLLAEMHGAELMVHDSPNFLSPAPFLETHIASKKKPFMARFYDAQRKRMNVLMENDGTPSGGKWSFDM